MNDVRGATSRRVGVVIVNYNSSDFAAACLRSLATEEIDFVLVWDNASEGSEVTKLRAACHNAPNLDLVESSRNIGFGPAVNAAINKLTDRRDLDYVWVLNPDVLVRPGAVAALIASAELHATPIVSPLVVRMDHAGLATVWYSGGEIRRRSGRSVHLRIGELVSEADVGFSPVSFMSGAAPLIDVSAWSRLGGFEEDLFLYCEDAELSIRAADLGIAMGVERSAVVEHAEGGSTGGHGPGPTFYYYVQRNRLRVYRRFASPISLLLGAGLAETARLLIFPIRASGGEKLASFAASMRGIVAGLRGEIGPKGSMLRSRGSGRVPDGATVPISLRVYEGARTAHLERRSDDDSASHQFLYRTRSYDFDESLAAEIGALQKGRVATFAHIVRVRPSTLELNEPAMVGAWLSVALYVCAAGLSSFLAREPTRIVTYAIENADISAAVSKKLGLPSRVSRYVTAAVVSTLQRRFQRIAFGTPGAEDNYRTIVGDRSLSRSRTQVFLPTEPRCDCTLDGKASKSGVVFLGSFEERKGVRELIDAWPLVEGRVEPDLLRLVGRGPLEDDIVRWADAHSSVEVVNDPTRVRIHEILNTSSVLVLFSQRTHSWREQIGLPILEGLSHGCTIVTSDETGLSPWLRSKGHHVVSAGAGSGALADAIAEALQSPLPASAIFDSLPQVSGRKAADAWMSESSLADDIGVHL